MVEIVEQNQTPRVEGEPGGQAERSVEPGY